MSAEFFTDGSCTIDITSNIIRIDLITLQLEPQTKGKRITVEVNQQMIMPLENVLRAKMLGLSTPCSSSQQKASNAIH